jgi:hypothetical protein
MSKRISFHLSDDARGSYERLSCFYGSGSKAINNALLYFDKIYNEQSAHKNISVRADKKNESKSEI